MAKTIVTIDQGGTGAKTASDAAEALLESAGGSADQVLITDGAGNVSWGGFTQTGTGATARTITDKLKDVVSVKDFGAAGDNSTDDSSAIQAAIDAVDGGLSDLGEIEVFTGAVFLPSGRYKIDSSITLKKGVHLIGESQSSVLIRYTGSGKALATSTGASDENQFIWIRDLTIEGAGKSTTTHGLHFNGSYFDSGIERVSVTKCAKGIELERSWTFAILKSHFYECADGGVWDNGTAGLVSHTRFDQCDNIGLTVTSTANNTHHLNITDSVFQRCGQNGLKVEAVNWSGRGLYFEYNNADDGNHADLHLSGGSLPKQASVRDSTFIGHTANANDAIYSDTRELQLIGCFVSGSNYDSSLNGTANQNSVTVIGGQHSLPLDVDSGTAVNIESSDSVARLRSTGTGGIGIYGNPAATESFAVSTAQGREYINFEGATNQYVVLDTPAGRRNNIIFKSDGVAKFYVGRGDSDDVGDDWFYVDGTDNDTSPSFGVKTDGRIRFAELPTSASGLNDGEIWNDDGVVQLVGGSNSSAADSFTQTGTGASARTITDKLKDVVSVKDFGATGDGSTDDTAAIQAAISAGTTIRFPVGDYKITDTSSGYSLLVAGNNKRLVGEGKGSVLTYTSSNTGRPALKVTGDSVRVQSLSIDGSANATDSASTTSNCNGLTTEDVKQFVVEDCYITGGHYGIHIDNTGSSYGANQNNQVIGCIIRNTASSGVQFSRSEGGLIQGCDAQDCGTDGFKTNELTKSIRVVGNRASSCNRDGFDFYDGLIESTVSGNVSEGNTLWGYEIKGTHGGEESHSDYVVHGSVLDGNVAEGNGYDGFSVQSVRNTVISNCSAISNSRSGFIFNTVQAVEVSGCHASRNTQHGFNLSVSTSRTSFTGCYAVDNSWDDGSTQNGTYNGFQIQSGCSGQFNNCSAIIGTTTGQKGGQGYGFYWAAVSTGSRLTGCYTLSNVTGGLGGVSGWADGNNIFNCTDNGTARGFSYNSDALSMLESDSSLHVLTAGNAEIKAERSSGAAILTQAQSAMGRYGTTSNHKLQLMSNNTGRLNVDTDGTIDVLSSKLKLNGSGGSADQVLTTDGSGNVSWGGFTQTGTGASARTITDKLKDVVSVKDFGATGDGSTDDTTEIEAAIAHCQDSGENLYFPPGEYKITTTISLSSSGNSISLIGQSDGAWQNATAGTSLLWAGGANPMFEVSTSDYGFVGFHVRNEGTATDFVELTSGAIRTYMKDMTFYVNSGASAFSRSVVRSSGNRLGYSRFEHIECYGAAPKFVDIDGQSSSNGITPFYFGGRSIFESTSTQAMTVLYVKDETVDNVVIENCTFNQQGSELTIIDTTDTAATVTINSLSIRDIEWDYSVAGATSDRALKLKNVKNFTVTGGHWNCGGTVTAVAELENTNLVNCEGLYIRSAALFFDVDSDSTINLGRNYTDTSNVTRIVNDSAPGVIPVTWTAGNVLILGHTGAGNGHTIYEISPTSGSGWTLSYRHGSAGYLVPGQMITIRIKNASGGAISAGTPVSTFRTTAALVAPEDGYSRYYTFIWDGSAWNEVSRSEKDVSNSGTNTATGVIIDNSQRLGIGTAPSDLLHLSSSSPVIRGDDSDGGSAKINFGSGNITLDADHGSAQGSSIINFKVDGTEAGRFTDDGTLDLKSEKLKLNGSGGSADQVLKTDGSGNVSWSGGPAEIGIACSDETSALTEGECATVMVPKGLTIKEVKASLTEAGSSGGVQVNVKYHASNPNSAASIFTTSSALTIATSDYKNNITTFTDGSGGSQSTYTAAEDGFLVVDIPSSSSPDSAARGLKVWVLGEWS